MLYRDICTAEDQPHSVAISPTRQCVAFGCKSGVELYWVDPTTAQNLNRWFRLNKSADSIYFLPARRSKDTPLRLRLISSTRYAPSINNESTACTSLSTPHDSWFTLRASWHLPLLHAGNRQRSRSTEWGAADHSNAIPLSDGHHILFTDNATGTLCLGSDTLAGNVQRLARKIFFDPPPPFAGGTGVETHRIPTLYAASHDLTHGVLIAAIYGEDLIMYSVPIDILRYSTAEQEGTIVDSTVPFHELKELCLLSHPASNAAALQQSDELPNQSENEKFERLNMLWVHHLPSPGARERERTSLGDVWPVRIMGRRIGMRKCG
ncbi:hypothetical protein BDY17DRAFT_311857 [Neohortaea acidophila]|uniref:Uncharacterized protein n=1 Tax=Neohortaea acidophila TaxID=245834 RepID=A0A6A6PMM5_9PEZI|nr:uncharacterized protein BDY17DRAFT_311857 [Neohortaea acidophila]KAF2481066.1 hypothetical protein BDY17DRAFT_311857 [Neohortaea acidophila]